LALDGSFRKVVGVNLTPEILASLPDPVVRNHSSPTNRKFEESEGVPGQLISPTSLTKSRSDNDLCYGCVMDVSKKFKKEVRKGLAGAKGWSEATVVDQS